VVADLRVVQDRYFANCDQVTPAERASLPLGRRALENVARLTDSLL
jgi:hypothetical protein